jgi:SAM-dependent methyltransferase
LGIDIHNLNFLAHAADLGVSFERTLAIGRQALFIEAYELEDHRLLRGLPALAEPAVAPGEPRYFESLMKQWLGAAVADSVDASNYENATYLHDMNLPWPERSAERGRFDAVLDFGCLEHVFNFPVAWRNGVDLCRVGGHVLHALPANNLSGHGFYQFSPELFYNLYQEKNGFEMRGVYFAIKGERRYWWTVANPLEVQRRVNLCNSHEVYMLVLARKLRDPGVLAAPQQSDYAQDEWVQERAALPSSSQASMSALTLRQATVQRLAQWGVIDTLRAARERLRGMQRSAMDLPAPDYQRVDVRRLITPGTP